MSYLSWRAFTVTAGVGALLAVGVGIAAADTGDASPPTDVHVLDGIPPVPVSDPAVLQDTVLPPAYNGASRLSR